MARLPRLCLPDIPQHIIQRGTNRQVCFAAPDDFAAYAHWLAKAAKDNDVAIHAWVFMTNHVHLLVTPKSDGGISKMMQNLGRHYVRYFNHTYKRTGTLWEGRFKSCVIDSENYLLICQRYIELNPVRAGMVETPEQYAWSSYHANGLGKPAKFWTPHGEYLKLGQTDGERIKAYQALFSSQVDQNIVKDIRASVQKELALGNDKFKQQIEALTGRRVVAMRRGPKNKKV